VTTTMRYLHTTTTRVSAQISLSGVNYSCRL